MNTKPTYTARSLEPTIIDGFNPSDHDVRTRRNRLNARRGWGVTVPVLPPSFNVADHVSAAAVASIHKAFTLAKTSHDDWRSYKREGRFDPRRAAGASRMEQDIFKRKTGRSTTKVKCAILLDASGSMGERDTARLPDPANPSSSYRVAVRARMAAGVFGATVATALGRVPTVDLDVFEHSADINNALFIKYRWHRGTPVAVFNETASALRPGGGNADGHALFAITSRMLRDLKRGERGVIMVVSDGMPSVYGKDGDSQAGQALIDAVAHARKHGIEVVAVAVDGSDQSVFYGDGVIPFTGDWGSMGRDLAKHIGKALARR